MTTTAFQGCVVESFGRHVIVRTATAERIACRLHGRRLEVAVGDDVTVHTGASAGEFHVVDRAARRNVFERSNSRGGSEALAANLDQIGIVVAPKPVWDPFIVDRYLAGARFSGIFALLLQGKCDLDATPEEATWLSVYEAAGVPVLRLSARSGNGIAELEARLAGTRTLLVGQSGVGKSTLFNRLSGGAFRTTRELSVGSEEGRHTTVSSAIVTLPWGELVDSPGVRDYAPPVVALRDVQAGFAEIESLGADCRFQDCLHTREPGCAVSRALGEGRVDGRRYESYRRLLNLMRQLEERRGYRS